VETTIVEHFAGANNSGTTTTFDLNLFGGIDTTHAEVFANDTSVWWPFVHSQVFLTELVPALTVLTVLPELALTGLVFHPELVLTVLVFLPELAFTVLVFLPELALTRLVSLTEFILY
jgi:hypothetical protein